MCIGERQTDTDSIIPRVHLAVYCLQDVVKVTMFSLFRYS